MRSRLPFAVLSFGVVALIAASCGSSNPPVTAGELSAAQSTEAPESTAPESTAPECPSFDAATIQLAAADDHAATDTDVEMDMDTDMDAEAAHDDDEAAHDDAEAPHDDDEATHDESMDMDAEAAHDDDEAPHDDDEATHDESMDMDAEAAHDDDEAPHDDEAAHDDDEAAHDGVALTAADVDMAFEVGMTEFAYECLVPEVPAGTVVALRFTNHGAVEHEAVVGDKAAQDDAEVAMSEMASGGAMHAHTVPSVTVASGESADLLVMFDEPGDLIIGCHIIGHFDAGMHTDLRVGSA